MPEKNVSAGAPAAAILVFLGAALGFAAGQGPPSQAQVVDSLGRSVTVPPRVDRVISLEPEVTRIIVALGAGDRLAGVDFFLRHYDRLFPVVFPAAAELPVISNQGQDLNYEEALRLRPDIIFSSPSEFRTTEAIEKKTGRPVAALASQGRFRDLVGEIETLGRLLGREGRAAVLSAYFRERVEAIRRSVARTRGASGPTVYLSFWGSLLRTPVAYEPVDAAGGQNLASGLVPAYLGTAGTTVSMESILRWDPEVILVQGNYPPAERQVTVESVLRDPRLASVRAVRSGRVYYTFGFWYWWDPALVLVETAYLAWRLHPDLFPDFDLAREGEEAFHEFYGREGLFRSLCEVLKCHEWTRS